MVRFRRENIGYGVPNVTVDAIVRAAQMANAHAFISAMPLVRFYFSSSRRT